MVKQHRETRQKQIVLDAVCARCDHPTADEIYLDVRAADEHISRGTVYRNLNCLSESGQISRIKVPGADRYDRRRDIHYHMVCTKCGAVYDVPLEYNLAADKLLEEKTGFSITRHRTVFEGVCLKCRSTMEK